jgi:hypothetical protein
MNKGVKIVYRKTIREPHMLLGFERLSGNALPKSSSYKNTRTWQFDLTKESGVKALKELSELFELPFKDIQADRLFCKMIVHKSDDVLFEAHEWDETYQLMSRMGYI